MTHAETTAVLFDIDGTLVDSNFLHVEAWSAAFANLGLVVPAWRIQRAIGADGSELLSQLIDGESDDTKSRASDLQSEYYQKLTPRLQLLPGAKQLLSAVAFRGSRVVLATSAPEDELKHLLTPLDADDLLHAVTPSEDVETTKPNPDIIAVALQKAEVDPESAIMIGDAVWDVKAAQAAGVSTIALRSGGTGSAELTDAGALAVYDEAADLVSAIDDSPLARLWR